MAAGDITKKMVFEVRDTIGDLDKKKIRADKIIIKDLNRKMRMAMTVYNTSRVQREYDLVQNQSDYEIEDDVLQIVGCRFNEEINTDIILPTLTNEDSRILKLTNSESFSAGQVMILDIFIKPTEENAMSSTKDPIIDPEYHDILVDLVTSDYGRQFNIEGMPNRELILKELEIVARRKNAINRVFTKQVETDRINF